MGVQRARTAAAAYLVLQGLAVPAWWGAMAVSPAVRARFELGDPSVLDAFRLPDVVLATCSLAAGALAARRPPDAAVLAGAACGVVMSSTALTLVHVAAAGRGRLGAVAMVAATAGSAGALGVLRRASAQQAPAAAGPPGAPR